MIDFFKRGVSICNEEAPENLQGLCSCPCIIWKPRQDRQTNYFELLLLSKKWKD